MTEREYISEKIKFVEWHIETLERYLSQNREELAALKDLSKEIQGESRE